jgi:hypothetical protein
MEYKNKVLLYTCICLVFLISYGYVKDLNERQSPLPETTSCREDSLQNVINQLVIDKEHNEDGWDDKEKRYEQVIFEFQYGLDHLKNYHQQAYRDFHRILSHKEYYSHEDERENKKTLQIEK